MRHAVLRGLVVLAGLAAGCSSARLEGAIYRDRDVAFRVGEVPAGWRLVDAKGARLAFRDDAARLAVLVNARCGADADDAPLAALAGHLFFQFTERATLVERVEPLDRREALHVRLRAKLDGVPRELDAFVLKKDGCVYDFVADAPEGALEPQVAAFERFVAGFRAIDRGD